MTNQTPKRGRDERLMPFNGAGKQSATSVEGELWWSNIIICFQHKTLDCIFI